ncbi:MAG TPA: hypothetical protein VJ852_03450 [Gemmatimonadaceae bacterium]|nr:hypothetical protein [Gemmatimonadaceae bacterium]
MKIVQLWVIAAGTTAALACASKPTPISVAGDSGDRASLAGKWVGEYSSSSTGRSGSIVFNLSPSGEAANGDVVMIPRGYGRALQPYNVGNTAPGAGVQNTTPSQVLTIKLVRVSGDTVSGVLDAYRDPECDCRVQTTFVGRLNGDVIEGTFTTTGRQAAGPQTGTWRVKRSG